MSGGRLVVLDRVGREVKQYNISSGLATLGSGSSCDVHFLLPTVESHHATIVVHSNQSVIHNVGCGETLVNGASVSVAALRHGDLVTLGGRKLRWQYAHPPRTPRSTRTSHSPHTPHTPHTPRTAERVRRVRCAALRQARAERARARTQPRRSAPLPPRAAHAPHRATMHGAVSARQVAVVQPQRRDTADQPAVSPPTSTSKRDPEVDATGDGPDGDKIKSPGTSQINLQNTTKATLWIESRKTSPRKSAKESPGRAVLPPRRPASAKKSTPLRLAVLRRAQSAGRAPRALRTPRAPRTPVAKIQAPATIDYTKQAAIMLMTGHTPRKTASPKSASGKRASFVVKKRSPLPSARASSSRRTPASPGRSTSVLELQESDILHTTVNENDSPDRTAANFPQSPLLSGPKKSALKHPASSRKSESIKFDLSNLGHDASKSMDILTITDSTRRSRDYASSEDELSLHYSDSSSAKSPSPRGSIHSRSSRILEKTLGVTVAKNTEHQPTLTPESPKSRSSVRGSMMLQKVMQNAANAKSYSRQTTATLSDQSWNTTAASERRSRTLGSRASATSHLEAYSIVDLVSGDSNATVYTSASDASTSRFDTPQATAGRNTRSSRTDSLLASSTPLNGPTTYGMRRAKSLTQHRGRRSPASSARVPNNETFSVSAATDDARPPDSGTKDTIVSTRRSRHRNSAVENSKENVTYNKDVTNSKSSSKRKNNKSVSSSASITKTSKSFRKSVISTCSHLTDSDSSSVNILNSATKSNKSHNSGTDVSPLPNGSSTPENKKSPEDLGTPVLSIQSLLDASANLTMPQRSKRSSARIPLARRTISGRWSTPRNQVSLRAKPVVRATRASKKSSKVSLFSCDTDLSQDDGETTPKSAVMLVQEGVKNKHSTAKKPHSKRSIIDHLNESDIVKQLFNSPVKRKLSQSMLEFSRKHLLESGRASQKKTTRNTIAATSTASDVWMMENTQAFSPEVFVSPLSTPGNSPDLAGLKRLFAQATPENDLRDVAGVRRLMRTPRNRRSANNDLSDVAGVKAMFASPHADRLADVRVKDLFAASPDNDLTRVQEVKALYRSRNRNTSPNNDLGNVAGVRDLFKKKAGRDDLRDVSGVRATMRTRSPRNELVDVRGVRALFRRDAPADYTDISGVEQLFAEPQRDSERADATADSSFDLLIGKPAVRSYPKAKSLSGVSRRNPKVRQTHSLKTSFSLINDNVENWLENELRKRMPTDENEKKSARKAQASINGSGRKASSRVARSTRNKLEMLSSVTPLEHDSGNTSTAASKNLLSEMVSLNRSTTKRGGSRELLKLATDTVEGISPVLKTRVRNSALHKPTSETYGAYALPIKKRSLVDTSTKGSGDKKAPPMKKRALVHSTPMKSRFNATASLSMNATDIRSMSPIAGDDGFEPTPPARQQPLEKSPPRKPTRTRRTKAATPSDGLQTASVTANVSPKKKEMTVFSPLRTRRTRNNKLATSADTSNVKRRKATLAIGKKQPALSPELNTSGGESKSPKTKINRRKKTEQKQPELETENEGLDIKLTKSRTKHTRGQNAKNTDKVDANPVPAPAPDKQLTPIPPKTRSTRRQMIPGPRTSNVANKKDNNLHLDKKSTKQKVTRFRNTVIVIDAMQLESTEKKNIGDNESKGRGRRGKKISSADVEVASGRNGSAGLKSELELKPIDEGLEQHPKRGRRTAARKPTRAASAEPGAAVAGSARGRKRKIADDEPAQKLKKFDVHDDVAKSGRRKLEKEHLEVKQMPRGRAAKVNEKRQVTGGAPAPRGTRTSARNAKQAAHDVVPVEEPPTAGQAGARSARRNKEVQAVQPAQLVQEERAPARPRGKKRVSAVATEAPEPTKTRRAARARATAQPAARTDAVQKPAARTRRR
ncbi:serine-rich adhesin for platelets-like isoform X2 [Battus philenor]|uniref:serine-rich adhesin for platelets-like isoform X2 n=1 Tax=Battus philenor TaxID=42288 RepID=UPI0035D10FA8